ncbi:hypothetical protein [Nocardioides sp. cx-173]|uniref:hypothetical protein n=1 Tax=Nocardioides sp. cx-173 TaxID=2898796 RepID=UPI001E4053A9|nr:hypothetical protein [Nocardioides sp. cx-173]MCD4525542.1 hypothetical protein [Nocardioides sp. cx-173]UGB42686.1 hypothetical protein LQ940_03965 [Nocardioides sp. cx-173]
MRRAVPALVGVLVLWGGSACTSPDEPPEDPTPVVVGWEQVPLPVPDGPAGRVGVRDAVACDGTWWLVGTVFTGGDGTRPAAWRSDDDGRTWQPLRFAPRAYWARRAVLSSVACRGDRVVMVGAKSGGAHGNPRVSTWYQRGDGAFVDVIAPFPLFGGVEAVSVERVAAGPSDWLIAGNRTSGAAVWVSQDEREFELVDDDPALGRDERVDTLAIAQVHDGEGWTVVGSGQVEGRIVPMAWVSPDGRTWSRQEVPAGETFTELQRVAATDDGVLAVGLRDGAVGSWRRTGSSWVAGESFGPLDPDRAAFAGPSGLVASGDRALATASDGTSYAAWATLDSSSWRPVEVPVNPAAGGGQVLTVAGTDETLLLLADDGLAGRVWRASWPG